MSDAVLVTRMTCPTGGHSHGWRCLTVPIWFPPIRWQSISRVPAHPGRALSIATREHDPCTRQNAVRSGIKISSSVWSPSGSMADGHSRPRTRQCKAHTLEKAVTTSLVETIPVVGNHVTDQAASPGVYDEAPGDVSVSGPLPISVQGPAPTHYEIVSNTRHPAGSREVQQLRQRLTALETSMFLHSGPRVVPSSGPLPRSSVALPATSVGMEPSGYPYAVTSVRESELLGFPQAVPSIGSSTVGATRAGWSTFEAGPDPWGPRRMEFGMTQGDPRRSHSLGDAARGEPRMRLPEYDGKGDWKEFHMQFSVASTSGQQRSKENAW